MKLPLLAPKLQTPPFPSETSPHPHTGSPVCLGAAVSGRLKLHDGPGEREEGQRQSMWPAWERGRWGGVDWAQRRLRLTSASADAGGREGRCSQRGGPPRPPGSRPGRPAARGLDWQQGALCTDRHTSQVAGGPSPSLSPEPPPHPPHLGLC